jgi:hypothetical protein
LPLCNRGSEFGRVRMLSDVTDEPPGHITADTDGEQGHMDSEQATMWMASEHTWTASRHMWTASRQ